MKYVRIRVGLPGRRTFAGLSETGKIKKGRHFPGGHALPLYEYRCTSCGYSFEKIQNFSAKPETECPKCQGVLIRPVTAPALRFEGAGWYVNDYAGKGGAKGVESAPKSGDSEGSSAAPAEDAKSTGAESGASTPAPTATSSAVSPGPANSTSAG